MQVAGPGSQASGPAWLGSSVRYHGPKEASPPDQAIPTRDKELNVTFSSSGAQDLREPPLHRPYVQTGTLRPESKLRVRPQIPTSPSKAHRHPRPPPQDPSRLSVHSLQWLGLLAPASLQLTPGSPRGRKCGSLLSLEKLHCPLHRCAKGLWLRTGPRKVHLLHHCGGRSSVPKALISTWRDIQW